MKTIDSFLETLQNKIEVHLNSQEEFKEIPVLSHQQSNLEGCLSEFVQTGVGLSIVVLNPLPLHITPGKSRVAFEEVQLRIHVIENICAEKADVSALSVAEQISRVLHHFQPNIEGWRGWVSIDEYEPWKEIKDQQKVGRYILELNFTVQGTIIVKRVPGEPYEI